MIKPLGDRIVIKVIEETEQTSGGIFIPDSAKEKPQRGEIVAVGLGKLNDKGEREPRIRPIRVPNNDATITALRESIK